MLAVIAMLAAAIAAFFYLRLTIIMYSAPPEPLEAASGGGGAGVAVATRPATARIVIPVGAGIALAICVVFTIVVGVVPSPVIGFARHATLLF